MDGSTSPTPGSVYSVAIKPSTRSARSISVTSVLKRWRHGGLRERPIGCSPKSRLGESLSATGHAEPVLEEHVLSVSAIAEVIGPPRYQLYRTGECGLLSFRPSYVERPGERLYADLAAGQSV